MLKKSLFCLLLLAGAALVLPAAGNPEGGSSDDPQVLTVEIHHCES